MQVTVLPDFDNYAWQNFDDDLFDFEYQLGDSAVSPLQLGYRFSIIAGPDHDYYYRCGLDYLDFTDIPAGSTVTAVAFTPRVLTQDGSGGSFKIAKSLSPFRFSTMVAQDFWENAAGDAAYATTGFATAPPNIYTIALGGTAVADVQAKIGQAVNHLSISVCEVDISSLRRTVQSVEAGATTNPGLLVTFTPPAGWVKVPGHLLVSAG